MGGPPGGAGSAKAAYPDRCTCAESNYCANVLIVRSGWPPERTASVRCSGDPDGKWCFFTLPSKAKEVGFEALYLSSRHLTALGNQMMTEEMNRQLARDFECSKLNRDDDHFDERSRQA